MPLLRACHPSHTASAHNRARTDIDCSLILSRIDYCNAVLYRAPMTTINKLQRIQNNAARIVLQMPKRTHAKPLLEKLHWLPVEQHIRYKIAVLTFKVWSTCTPKCISQPPCPDTSMCSRHSVISDSSAVRAVHQNQLRQAHLPLLGSSCLEFATEDSARLCHFVNF